MTMSLFRRWERRMSGERSAYLLMLLLLLGDSLVSCVILSAMLANDPVSERSNVRLPTHNLPLKFLYLDQVWRSLLYLSLSLSLLCTVNCWVGLLSPLSLLTFQSPHLLSADSFSEIPRVKEQSLNYSKYIVQILYFVKGKVSRDWGRLLMLLGILLDQGYFLNLFNF
jgi:hypothetical protein